MIFLSKSNPKLDNSALKSEFEIEPKSLPPVPDFALIFISSLTNFFAILLASSISFFSLNSLCLIFSAKTFLAEGVARIAKP